jgi:alpha-D-ribose 1-methylphosphonate 5-triphosphate diphosphatase
LRVLTPEGIRPASLSIEGGRIATVGPYRPGAGLDCGNRLVAPGLIDLHGDAFERQWMPRARVFFPLDIALVETDHQLLANGITTAYHGLTLSWEPGLRGIDHGRLMVNALTGMRPRLRCDTRLHLRFEVYAVEQTSQVLGWIAAGHVHLVGFNDHLLIIEGNLSDENKAGTYASRTGLTLTAFASLLRSVKDRAGEVDAALDQISAACRERTIPMASHDDESPAMHERYYRLGARICEFPVDLPTAREALAQGSDVVMGGPNVVRGRSHTNRIAARDAVAAGVCTVLTSDYYYPSMLHAVYRLHTQEALPLESLWPLVSGNGARAAGLSDRGQLAEGLRADLIVIDSRDPGLPRVSAAMVNGRVEFLGDAELAGGADR